MNLIKCRPFLKRTSSSSSSITIAVFFMLFFIVNVIKSQENVVDDDDDDFDEELYSVIYSVRDDDGSLWSNSRKIRSIDINRYSTSSNTTSNNHTLTDNSLWNDLWFECKKKPSFTCVRTGVFKYLDKSLDNSKDLRLTDSLFFRGNKNKYNGFCENTEEEMEKCLKYNEEKLKITKVADSENDNNDVKLNDTIDVITGNGKNINYYYYYHLFFQPNFILRHPSSLLLSSRQSEFTPFAKKKYRKFRNFFPFTRRIILRRSYYYYYYY